MNACKNTQQHLLYFLPFINNNLQLEIKTPCKYQIFFVWWDFIIVVIFRIAQTKRAKTGLIVQ